MSCVNVAVNAGNCNISRQQMCQWVGELTGHNVSKVENLSSGFHYCVLYSMIFPNSIQMSKVKSTATQQYEKLNNFKVLQQGFKKCRCNKTIPVDELVKGKFQDNFIFLQWFYKFYEANSSGDEDRIEFDGPAPKQPIKKSTSNSAPRGMAGSRPTSKTRTQSGTAYYELEEEITTLRKEFTNAQMKVDELEKERDFYFSKLLNIEAICQEEENAEVPIVHRLTEILWAEPGTELPEDATF